MEEKQRISAANRAMEAPFYMLCRSPEQLVMLRSSLKMLCFELWKQPENNSTCPVALRAQRIND